MNGDCEFIKLGYTLIFNILVFRIMWTVGNHFPFIRSAVHTYIFRSCDNILWYLCVYHKLLYDNIICVTCIIPNGHTHITYRIMTAFHVHRSHRVLSILITIPFRNNVTTIQLPFPAVMTAHRTFRMIVTYCFYTRCVHNSTR